MSRILNEKDEEIQSEDVDYDLGYLVPDKVLKEHHEAIEGTEEQGHFYPTTYYMVDGTTYQTTLGAFREQEKKILEEKNKVQDVPTKPSNDVSAYEQDEKVFLDTDKGVFGYKTDEGNVEYCGGSVLKGIVLDYIIDQEATEPVEAWDEYEDIQRYKLYTEEELAQRKQEAEENQKIQNFLETGPDRLDSAETDIGDLTILMADLIGV